MLQIILFILGIVGLIKKRIKITSKRELTGKPVVALSIFYLLMALVLLLMGAVPQILFIVIGIVFVVTLIVIIFAGSPIDSSQLSAQNTNVPTQPHNKKKIILIVGIILVLGFLGVIASGIWVYKTTKEKCGHLGNGYVYVPGSGCVLQDSIEKR
ncbi:hypothetical protein A2662_01380 [Candidatus Giovannonibacteria bacterium RIFCSPHIGHO2_01_FULL_45_33]|uniref:Uncharacterized protein n=1 Tax=Candidatus Giovannonibacteria bacterium RIFCSPLOWO2_01_FULL_45_34 TaxID=1798351 RepID=A0A1F5WZR2_9BACT|nr:MAG: hypothetical protein A2662_01380 [Candidatus Giovannonibacteria bacterium RIFCSPHIGHO2_01_FULL_45_33]OGF69690.1 MAG: hypothetical protein A3C73_00110 [Candidatus Giovannonibacteria bacterium RIFCSPHIGHO2_02_FULL_44_11]OGF81146.1 MAG: hypothetical protein A2930_01095 [Candidatus Giovannonibacteria bacterium RIFCSPLOWO2_01_FULL_45_34]